MTETTATLLKGIFKPPVSTIILSSIPGNFTNGNVIKQEKDNELNDPKMS